MVDVGRGVTKNKPVFITGSYGMKRPVLQSGVDLYFDHARGGLPVWVLDGDEATRVWRENFDARSWVFFDLPPDWWVEIERAVPAAGGAA